MVQQQEGRERLRDKLPTIVQQPDWWFPPRLACEQCSSELTATYKAELIRPHYTPSPSLSPSLCREGWGGSPSPSLCREGRGGSFIDLTGGYGIDSFYLSALANEAHYVEQNPELCRIAEHNFARTRPHLQVHNTTAEEFLCTLPDIPYTEQSEVLCTKSPRRSEAEFFTRSSLHEAKRSSLHEVPYTNRSEVTCIFLDPARRDNHGGKVFRIEDCTPNIIDLLPLLQQKSTVLMFKLSPMLDITAALRSLGAGWQVHILAVRNEVKELLFVKSIPQLQQDPPPPSLQREGGRLVSIDEGNSPTLPLCRGSRRGSEGRRGSYTAANYTQDHWQTLSFTPEQEQNAQVTYWHSPDAPRYLYEPNAAILKAAAFRFVSEHFRLTKLAPNTHLYAADHLLTDFPGRVWEVVSPLTSGMLKHLPDTIRERGASILTRNYPMTADQLRKKLKIKDSAEQTIIAARIADKTMLFWAKRV